jgi:hypothetical protein
MGPRAHRGRVVSVVLAGGIPPAHYAGGGLRKDGLPGGERAYLAPEGAAPSTRLGARRGCASLTAPPPSPVWRGRKDDLARGACVHLLGVSGPLVWHRPVEICSTLVRELPCWASAPRRGSPTPVPLGRARLSLPRLGYLRHADEPTSGEVPRMPSADRARAGGRRGGGCDSPGTGVRDWRRRHRRRVGVRVSRCRGRSELAAPLVIPHRFLGLLASITFARARAAGRRDSPCSPRVRWELRSET